MNELEPRVIGPPAVSTATSQGRSRARGRGADPGGSAGASPPGQRDRAELSAAARAHLVQDDSDATPAHEPLALAHRIALDAGASVAVAGAAHTAAVVRAARLIR